MGGIGISPLTPNPFPNFFFLLHPLSDKQSLHVTLHTSDQLDRNLTASLIDNMSFSLLSLGFAPRSLTFPAGNVVKAVAIASFAALAVNALLKAAAPLQADDEHEHDRVDEKVSQSTHITSADGNDANHLSQIVEDTEPPKRIESVTPKDHAVTESIKDDKASHNTEPVVALKDVDLTKDAESADDNISLGADSTTTAVNSEAVPTTQEDSPIQHNEVPEKTATDVASVVTDKSRAANSSTGVRSYHHTFPATDIIEVVDIPPKHGAVRSYRHSLPAIEIIEVVEAPRNHVRKDSTETDFSVQTVDSKASSPVPSTPDTVYSVPDPDVELSEQQLTPTCDKELKNDENQEDDALTSIPGVTITTLNGPSSDQYDYSHLSPEEFANLSAVIVFDRPDNGLSYAQLTCGNWYRMDENDNPQLMTEEEYDDLLAWFAICKKKEEDAKLPIPVVLVTDEEGNESIAEEIMDSAAEVTANRVPSQWYSMPCLFAQESADIEPGTVIERPDNGLTYVQLEDGMWYRFDESETALMMTQEEYEDLLNWFNSFKQEKQKVNFPPPIVLVTDEEGNEFLAEEDEASFVVNQPIDVNTQEFANGTITLTD